MKPRRQLFGFPAIFVTPVFVGFTFAISGLTADAGDILRGGTPATNKPGRSGGGTPTPAATDAARANAKDTLARTTSTLAAMRDMQNAARNAAIRNGANNLGKGPNKAIVVLPKVPNGIALGGLKPTSDPTKWTGADRPVQTIKKGKTQVTIRQTTQQALLNWDSFNVGKKTTLTFDQSKGGADVGKWIAFNRITDASGNPTQILGKIKADGQVYLINPNGIIFGAGSQVNARGLTVSSLPINTNLIARGILNNPDAQFLFSGLAIPAGANGTPAFTPDAPLAADGKYGDVVVREGAVLKSPSGGRVTLVGPNVVNDGSILTPDGQAILAAGLQVGFDGHDSSDPNLRGLDIFVGAVEDPIAGAYAGMVTHGGVIEAERGAITIAGREIHQDGVLYSTTSVALNGRIDLQANYNAVSNPSYDPLNYPNIRPFLFKSSGTVTLGENSLTTILPEVWSKDRVVASQWTSASRSQINLQGLAIHLTGDATIFAPNAGVTALAGAWNFVVRGGRPQSDFLSSKGQIYLDSGALIDVSGSENVAASVADQIVAVQLLGAELADSPLQRDGILRGQTIYVDAGQMGTYNGKDWIGTPLADASGYIGLIKRTVGQLTAEGGTVTLKAGDSVVMQAGSKIDVSGGTINYKGGVVGTTRLVSGGRLYDISEATPDLVYDGIYGRSVVNNPKWNNPEAYSHLLGNGRHFEAGYRMGGDAGSISISAASMALDGVLDGKTTQGARQLTTSPRAGSLSLTFERQDPATLLATSPVPPDIVFRPGVTLSAADAFALDPAGNPVALRADRAAEVVLSPDLLTRDGFGKLSIVNPDGDIVVPEDVSVIAPVRGSITLSAANITIDGKVSAAGGTLNFTTYDYSPYSLLVLGQTPGAQTPAADPTRGRFILGAKGSLETAGLVVDDRANSSVRETIPQVIKGGTISITSYSAELRKGGVIDVSGGLMIDGIARESYGDAGSITIKAGQDPKLTSLIGGELVFESSLKGYAGQGAASGKLTIQAPLIQIGGMTDNSSTLLLSPRFFSSGGFGSFSLTGLGLPGLSSTPAVLITPGTKISPKVESWHAVLTGDGVGQEIVTLPEGLRNPVALAFAAPGVTDYFTHELLVRGDIVMGAGSAIRTDAYGSVSINGNTVAVLGSITTPGGKVVLTGGADSTLLFADQEHALATVDLGAQSVISTAGKRLLIPDDLGYRSGAILNGGDISISGNIVAEKGAILDVSGAAGILDLEPGRSGGAGFINTSQNGIKRVPTRVESDGGTITLTGKQELFLDATLLGAAGGSSSRAGSLSISSGRFIEPNSGMVLTPVDTNIQVTQGGLTIPGPFYPAGQTAIGQAVMDKEGNIVDGMGYFSASSFQSSGMGSLSLAGNVHFAGPVSLSAADSLTVATGGILSGDSAIKLSASYLAVGTGFLPPREASQIQSPFQFQNSPYSVAPTYGSGELTVKADLIDIGYLSLQDIGKARFVADHGDIRGNGILDVAGDVTLKAGQIYPTTATSFTIAAHDHQIGGLTTYGSVTIQGSGTRALPLSAGGTLNIFASIIHQGGVLRAPFGTINIGWDGKGTGPTDLLTGQTFDAARQVTLAAGSITSVSAIDPVTGKGITIPYGLNLNGTSWISPIGTDITASGLPDKAIHISAGEIDDQDGSVIDIRGGGDLLAYRFNKGTGGTIDFLGSSSGFAVIPGFGSDYAPYAPFNPSATTPANLGSDKGYLSSGLKAGDRVYLAASSGLPAGYYTLLPARYALLAGAFLVTPKTDPPTGGAARLVDGAHLVSGYPVSGFNISKNSQPLYTSFEIASSDVVHARGDYQTVSANKFFSGTGNRRPEDAGHLVLAAASAMTLEGDVTSFAAGKGRAGMVDISSTADILIAGEGVTGHEGELVLDAGKLSGFGAESLLIGGTRTPGADGTTVSVNAGNLTVDNSGTALTGSDVILVANEDLKLAPGAEIRATGGKSKGTETLYLGNSNQAGSGDGLLVRVGSDPSARVIRSGTSASPVPTLTLGEGVSIQGDSIILDSTHATSMASSVRLGGSALTLASGRISIALDDPGVIQPTTGLVLAGDSLESLQAGLHSLALQSYSTIDLYGTGEIGATRSNGKPVIQSLALQAGGIRSFHNGGGSVVVSARDVILGNSSGGGAGAPAMSSEGALVFNARMIRFGANAVSIDGFTSVALNATGGILAQESGHLTAQGSLTFAAPVITGGTATAYELESGGKLTALSLGKKTGPSITGGLGASMTLKGDSVVANGDIQLSGGVLNIQATGGDVSIGGHLDVSGDERNFFDQVKYTGGGQINLSSVTGNVFTTAGSVIDVAGRGGSQAGGLAISAADGTIGLAGTLNGAGGSGGTFSLDVRNLPGASTDLIDGILNTGGFTDSRSIRVREGNVSVGGLAAAGSYNLSADHGSITVSGNIDASGHYGGTIHLAASEDVTILTGATLLVKARDFDAAGKGGVISLETRGENGGAIGIRSGSLLDLTVAAAKPPDAAKGRFSGTLHLRAPQTTDHTDVMVDPIEGAIRNASRIVVEGFNTYVPADGSIDSVKSDILANGNEFLGSAGTLTSAYSAMWNRLVGAGNGKIAPVLGIVAGAEIVSPGGDLTLAGNWDLSTFRFGPDGAAGVLTLRAAGNLNFNFRASLSDGFDGATAPLWQAPLLAEGSQSWSYRLIAGADLDAADFSRVRAMNDLGENTGSIILGKDSPALPIAMNNSRQTIIPSYYQTIRSGTGDIDIHAGRDVVLLNSLATIYTAGSQAGAMANFDLPDLVYRSTSLGSTQSPAYAAQYSLAGGNVVITAQNDIARYNVTGFGEDAVWTPDSTRELPSNWLYRRGYVDPLTGEFGSSTPGGGIGSTTWWVDFSNFYQGVGALGGGNVSLSAGRNVSNVDAVVPTNARMPYGKPDAARLLELGGGDLTVRAGHDIDGGVYYVERGKGTLQAGGSIHTNSTRAALTQTEINSLAIAGMVPDSTTWLPTTLFVGKGGFDVSSGGDLLLGAVSNTFLLPQGINNSFYNKSYFLTFDSSSSVNASSLIGSVVFKNDSSGGAGSLESWYQNVLLYYGNPGAYSRSQPWLRLAETSIAPFGTVSALVPGTLRAVSFSGDIGIVGDLTLAPSATGTVDLVAAGSINGLQITGADPATNDREWGYGSINLSDADPARIPGVASPLSLVGPPTGIQGGAWNFTAPDLLAGVSAIFNESGSVMGSRGVLQTKQALHAPGVLHADDREPVRLYAGGGDISGLMLFSAKSARVVAEGNITDVALYLQNTRGSDISLISAGGDIIAYDPNSSLREAAQITGNVLTLEGVPVAPLAGDFQISGPGTLEVLAGRNLDLGVGASNPDGTAVGITSIGNSRNPALPSRGADIIAGAGLGPSSGLDGSSLGFGNFIDRFLNPKKDGNAPARYLPRLGTLLGLGDAGDMAVWEAFEKLPVERRNVLSLEIFYQVLRDAGRDFNTTADQGLRNYKAGYEAIAALFHGKQWQGDISLTSRQIKTTSGGNISLFAPGGQLTVGYDIGENQPVDLGILTEAGGDISIFSRGNINVGTSRIFTLRGGNEIIWSSKGDIAAGASAKTVESAPPTRVLIDPQSAAVETDLAGLATGGGIGVLDTMPGVAAGDVDLIAPKGTVDAGDAGIRVSGNLNIAAPVILNSANIQVNGDSFGIPAGAVSGMVLGNPGSVWNTTESADWIASALPPVDEEPVVLEADLPSDYSVEILGYGDDGDDQEDEVPSD